MANLAIVHDEETTQQTTTDTSPLTELTSTGTDYTGSDTYLLIAKAAMGGDDVNALFSCRLAHGATPTAFPGSTAILEPGNGSVTRHQYGYMIEFDQPATPEDVLLQQWAVASGTSRLDEMCVLAIPTGELAANSYYYGEDDDSAGATGLTTSFASFASITFTPGTASQDWLILACYSIDVDNGTASSLEVQIDLDSSTQYCHARREGEDNAERLTGVMGWVLTLDATSHTIALQADTDGTNNDFAHVFSSIVAINLDANFIDHNWGVDTGTFSNSSNNVFEDSGINADVTPTSTGDFVCMAYSVGDAGGGRNMQLQIEAETSTQVGPESFSRTRDGTDETSIFTLGVVNLTSGALREIDHQVLSANTADHHQTMMIVAFSVALVVAGTTTRRYSLPLLGVG